MNLISSIKKTPKNKEGKIKKEKKKKGISKIQINRKYICLDEFSIH